MTIRLLALACCCAMLAACFASVTSQSPPFVSPPQTTPLKLVIIGDSTVANYPASVPDRGWGQFIGEHFNATVTVVNLARNGRSTKTFIAEGLWKQALEQAPDMVLIQFGHNDSHASDRPESTDAATDFRGYLREYVDDARAIGATPIFITPVQRRTYEASGRLDNSLRPYAQAMTLVAAEKGVAVIDLNESSGRLYERLGTSANVAVSRNGSDVTHFNERGARWMASLVMRDLLRARPELASRLKAGVAIPEEIDISVP